MGPTESGTTWKRSRPTASAPRKTVSGAPSATHLLLPSTASGFVHNPNQLATLRPHELHGQRGRRQQIQRLAERRALPLPRRQIQAAAGRVDHLQRQRDSTALRLGGQMFGHGKTGQAARTQRLGRQQRAAGNSEAVCPSSPMPSRAQSRRGIPSSAGTCCRKSSS